MIFARSTNGYLGWGMGGCLYSVPHLRVEKKMGYKYLKCGQLISPHVTNCKSNIKCVCGRNYFTIKRVHSIQLLLN